MTLSQIPSSPSFRSSAVNAVAIIPLLSSDRKGQDDDTTHSSRSFQELMEALGRHKDQSQPCSQTGDDILIVVPNSSLTRPSNWKYDNTPLKNFHWEYGCQRLAVFDGRPYNSRMAHDRLINHDLTRNWIDLCPHRRTAALIGVLNMRDVPDIETLLKAEQEWQQWAERYSTPPYEVTAHGRDFERDFVVQRLFVFDSFHEDSKVDMSTTSLGSSLVAFPPAEGDSSTKMMDMHTNVVVTDLAVAIFQELEDRIRESDMTIGSDGQPLSSAAARSRFFQLAQKQGEGEDEEGPQGSSHLNVNGLAAVVSSDNQLASSASAANKNRHPKDRESIQLKLSNAVSKGSSSEAQLLTPLDDVWDYSELKPSDAQEMLRREVGRREKFAADLSLLAGSPLDAYERYMKAADLCKTSCPDPLWYASALEGCAAAHVAMVEAGGYNVDTYLESAFQLPDEFMACSVASGEKTTKQTMSKVVKALCDDSLRVLSRHPRLACFRAELLLKLAWYTGEVEDTHIRCKWGIGEGCFGGDPASEKRRWEVHSSTQLSFLELRNKNGEDVVRLNTLHRLQEWTRVMHVAVAAGALDPVTRADVALRCASLCLKGLRPTDKPTSAVRSEERIIFNRKASFFATAAAEALSEIDGQAPDDRASAMWVTVSKLLSKKSNVSNPGNYGWATLRAVALHALSMQGLKETSEDAAVQLLSLMGEIKPVKTKSESNAFFSRYESLETDDGESKQTNDDSSVRSDYVDAGRSVASAARTFVREKAKDAIRGRQKDFFTGQNQNSNTLLAVAQSKWVDDDPVPSILLPVADFSDISNTILAMRAVWSAVKFDSCATAQQKLTRQISNLRKSNPTSSLLTNTPSDIALHLPIQITAVEIGGSESRAPLERKKVKVAKEGEEGGAMATFFNPYAAKSKEVEATLIPEGEERYILVKFANKLSIPMEVPRCQLEFDVPNSVRIKAPAISFVIPGQTSDFAVQFPFIFLNESAEITKEQNSQVFGVKGLYVTCLTRSFFLPLEVSSSEDDAAKQEEMHNIPKSTSLYPRRDYDEASLEIKSPRLEVVSAQPNLLISFATSTKSPLSEDVVIPAPIADGETFTIPKLLLSNNPGLGSNGQIEELCISAIGLPGLSEVVLFDLNKPVETDSSKEQSKPLSLKALCTGIDTANLNNPLRAAKECSISLQLKAATDMGSHNKGAEVKLRFRYRGKQASSALEVWRTTELTLHVLRIKGPRVSSITFRPDLAWGSGYSQLCTALADQDKHARYRFARQEKKDLPKAGSSDNTDFVLNRLGKDPGVHICGEKVVVILSVANETAAAIRLSSPDGAIGGFDGSPIETMEVTSGISAKIPIILPRVDRSSDICERLRELTTLYWESEEAEGDAKAEIESNGSMVPVNKRVRSGTIKIPMHCLKTIVDEHPTFLSRICKAPCAIAVAGGGGAAGSSQVQKGDSVDLSVQVELADWIPAGLLDNNNLTLEFCCAPKEGSSKGKSFIWCGQVKKTIPKNSKSSHRARVIFLSEGEYVVSACVTFKRNDVDDDVREIWWAPKAHAVKVGDSLLKQ
ncbi:unnamed protein product [Cylindrotheca closterium]|uniref:Trs120/TRAPPC9 N-terminal domain-containing protein n=1 Tax=Cylindrotheca closterium TaxID=2856 RepID=A0AAD2CLQ0_9STRA|nr:unnamed protein product [Cylindrotheca closterium]